MGDDRAKALADQIEAIEAACAGYDAGRRDESRRLATALRAIFEAATPTGSLLAAAGGAFVPILSTNVKVPAGNSGGCWPGLVGWDLDVPRSVFVGSPRLDAGKSAHRSVAPEFWWKSEAIYTRDHHQKVRRRDLALAFAEGGTPSVQPWLAEPFGWKTTFRAGDGTTRTIAVHDAAEASLRQMAHEVLHSKDLLRLAGR